MNFSTAEKIRIILQKQKMTAEKLAELTGQSRQNLSQKLRRDKFSEEELKELAEKMGVKYVSYFEFPNGERI